MSHMKQISIRELHLDQPVRGTSVEDVVSDNRDR